MFCMFILTYREIQSSEKYTRKKISTRKFFILGIFNNTFLYTEDELNFRMKTNILLIFETL